MKIHALSYHPYEIPLTNGVIRYGAIVNIVNEEGKNGWGEIAPLPKWSSETLKEALEQIKQKEQEIKRIEWTFDTYLQELPKLKLLPSVLFGLESALISILQPMENCKLPVSALLIGSPAEIFNQADLRYNEGYTSAKLKVSHLSFDDAAQIIHQLKDKFRLRIDVNRAWSTADSLRFFEQFPLNTFDYVEEPFANPHDLPLFKHPLAVDESFPKDLTFKQLESLQSLKALIYKPTLQGGMSGCLPLFEWTRNRNIELVLSSSFESDLGLAHIARMAHRLSVKAPLGIGTFNFLTTRICGDDVKFHGGFVEVGEEIEVMLK